MNSVYQAFEEAAESYPNNDFLHIPASASAVYASGALTFSYSEFRALVSKTIKMYTRSAVSFGLGEGRGESGNDVRVLRVALLLENRPEFFQHFFALNALGVSVVPVNAEMQPREQAYVLEHSEAKLLVCLPERIEGVKAALNLCEFPPVLVASNDLDSLSPSVTFDAKKQIPGKGTNNIIGSETECALLYTSGSTGLPKGCMLSNEYFLGFGRWYRDIGGYCKLEPGKERLLTPLPLVHMNAMAVSTMGMVMTGGCIVQLDRFHPRTWWQSVVDTGATAVHYLGVLPAILLALPQVPNETAHCVKFGFGAGVNPRHHQAFEERFGFPLIESWAMSESGSGGCVTANVEPRHIGKCCFGKPASAVEIRLVDEAGVEVAKGQAGELLVRAAGEMPERGFFSGYLKNPEATAQDWKGGWWHTGDVVKEDDDGSLFFIDRRKNVIRRSGENIAALEVEAALSGDPSIDTCVVCAVPDEMRGDEVMALIITPADVLLSQLQAEAIVNRARSRLSYFKLPGYVAVVEELPLTASQKPRRADIKILGKQLLEQGACFDLRHLKKREQKRPLDVIKSNDTPSGGVA